MKNDVIIIGGGAAGLTAALSASGQGARALVLEAAPRVGRKILASGNGRCNLANTGPLNYPGGASLARRVLENCPAERVLAFFHGLGLLTVQEEQGRVYPACGQAAAVLDVLRGALERRSVPVLSETPAVRIEQVDAHLFASAGLAGDDGETHQGIFDVGLLEPIPNLIFSQPCDAFEAASLMKTAFAQNHPFAIRYPKGIVSTAGMKEPEIIPVGTWTVFNDKETNK